MPPVMNTGKLSPPGRDFVDVPLKRTAVGAYFSVAERHDISVKFYYH